MAKRIARFITDTRITMYGSTEPVEFKVGQEFTVVNQYDHVNSAGTQKRHYVLHEKFYAPFSLAEDFVEVFYEDERPIDENGLCLEDDDDVLAPTEEDIDEYQGRYEHVLHK